jgi:hypothetical protein
MYFVQPRIVSILATLTAVLFIVGCGGPAAVDGRYGVSGTVTLDGEPLNNGTISFSPTAQSGRGSGSVIRDSRYEIPADKGMNVGEYFVRINAAEDVGEMDGAARERLMNNPDSRKPPKELIPAQYNDQSQHKVTITVDGPNEFNFDIATGVNSS